MKEKEFFYFHDGMNRKKSPLLLGQAEAYTLEGFSMEKAGVLEPRVQRATLKTITTLAYNQGIHRNESNVYAFQDHKCHGQASNASAWTSDGLSDNFFNHIYRRSSDSDGTYSKIGISRGSNRASVRDYKNFTFFADGEDVFVLDGQYQHDWRIPNPDKAPYLEKVASVYGFGDNGESFNYRYTYYLTFSNGEVVETGPSPAKSITFAAQSYVRVFVPKFCIEFPYSRDNITVESVIYRTANGGSTYYKVFKGAVPYQDPIDAFSNVDEQYNDTMSDATLITQTALTTTLYNPVPAYFDDIELHLQRMFGIKNDTLYWSEEYLPFAFKTASNIVVSSGGEDLKAIVAWGDRLWIVSDATWYCLVGSDDDSWAIKYTWTDKGITNTHTVARTEYGILGLNYEGVCLFNGYTSKCITEQILGKEFFDDIVDLDLCYASWDGRKYYLYYPSSGSTINDSIILDFTNYPQIIVYKSDFNATGRMHYYPAGTTYVVLGGYEYIEGGTATINSTWQTREVDFGDITERKALKELHYDLTGTVSVAIYADGSLAQTVSITETSRTRDFVKLARIEGYRFYMIITCSATASLELYEPMTLTAVNAGDI